MKKIPWTTIDYILALFIKAAPVNNPVPIPSSSKTMRKILAKSSLQAEKYVICSNLCNICKKPLPYLDDKCSTCACKYILSNPTFKYTLLF